MDATKHSKASIGWHLRPAYCIRGTSAQATAIQLTVLLTKQATDPVVQEPDPDHLGSDVAVLIQPVDLALGTVDNVPRAGGPHWLVGGLGSLGLVHRRRFLPDGLVEVVHPLAALRTADGSPFSYQLQADRCRTTFEGSSHMSSLLQ